MNLSHSIGKERRPRPINSILITYHASGRKIPARSRSLLRSIKSKKRLELELQASRQASKFRLDFFDTAMLISLRGRELLPHQRQRLRRLAIINGRAKKRWPNISTIATTKLGRIPKGKRRKRNNTSGMNKNSKTPRICILPVGIVLFAGTSRKSYHKK